MKKFSHYINEQETNVNENFLKDFFSGLFKDLKSNAASRVSDSFRERGYNNAADAFDKMISKKIDAKQASVDVDKIADNLEKNAKGSDKDKAKEVVKALISLKQAWEGDDNYKDACKHIDEKIKEYENKFKGISNDAVHDINDGPEENTDSNANARETMEEADNKYGKIVNSLCSTIGVPSSILKQLKNNIERALLKIKDKRKKKAEAATPEKTEEPKKPETPQNNSLIDTEDNKLFESLLFEDGETPQLDDNFIAKIVMARNNPEILALLEISALCCYALSKKFKVGSKTFQFLSFKDEKSRQNYFDMVKLILSGNPDSIKAASGKIQEFETSWDVESSQNKK